RCQSLSVRCRRPPRRRCHRGPGTQCGAGDHSRFKWPGADAAALRACPPRLRPSIFAANTLYSGIGIAQAPETSMSLQRKRPQILTLTDRAAERINAILARKGTGATGVRIGVKKGGCAGMEYTMDWVGEAQPHDEVVEHNGARVLIDAKA